MDETDLEKLGLNRNEAKVYLALLYKGQATAQELVKSIGVHRNIVYDNLEKLTEKGLVSTISENKKIFIAEKPTAIIEFLESKKSEVDKEIDIAKSIMPDISKLLASQKTKQDAFIFRGISGVKKIVGETIYTDIWYIGVTNESTHIMGETYWKNYNRKRKESGKHEWLLWNSNFKNTIIAEHSKSHSKVLPKELDQVTEIVLWHGKVAIFVYTIQPIVIVIESKQVFDTYRKHFDILWKISKDIKKKY